MDDRKKVRTDPKHPLAQLGKRLVLGKDIAAGGMGIVKEAFDVNLKRQVALKRPNPKLSREQLEAVRGRMIEEAQITAQLDHPNIVAVHELSVDEAGEIFFTMKLVKGEEFGDILSKKSCHDRTAKELFDHLQVFLKVCDTVAFAHSCGVIHRDLKPANVMVGDFGIVYLMDWGIAHKLDTLEWLDTQKIVTGENAHRYPSEPDAWAGAGTLWYMSPEQAQRRREDIDERTDVFLLGGILYEILTHLPPYDAKTRGELMEKAWKAEIEQPYERTSAYLPPALCRIAMKALRREKVDRYQSVLELKEDVENFMHYGLHFERRNFPAGSVIFEENDYGNEAYVILAGRCRVYKMLDGEKYVLREMGQGEVFGEIAVLTNEPRTASVEAIDHVLVQVIRREDFEEKLGVGSMLGNFMETLAKRFVEKDRRLIEIERELRQRK